MKVRDSGFANSLLNSAYIREIQPKLKAVTLSVLASTLGISIGYAADVRKGRRVPHPRHWKKLAVLANAKQRAAAQNTASSPKPSLRVRTAPTSRLRGNSPG